MQTFLTKFLIYQYWDKQKSYQKVDNTVCVLDDGWSIRGKEVLHFPVITQRKEFCGGLCTVEASCRDVIGMGTVICGTLIIMKRLFFWVSWL